MAETTFLSSGQNRCYNSNGELLSCRNTGQDGESRLGLSWPTPRFQAESAMVLDRLTGLGWSADAAIGDFPAAWDEAFEMVRRLNEEGYGGYADWRLPNRRELLSLMGYQTTRPPLPEGHPFFNVFLGWYWTSTTAAINPAFAWCIHLEGARMFYNRKSQEALVWPVRTVEPFPLPRTGQLLCYDSSGTVIPEGDTGQDGEVFSGRPWPTPRFQVQGEIVTDRLTGFSWTRCADPVGRPLTWAEALELIDDLNRDSFGGLSGWMLPPITLLESLVDCSRHEPALPEAHPFTHVREVYWSSTTSLFAPDWAWALYLHKGALGVGWKPAARFHLWPAARFSDSGGNLPA